MSPRKWVSFFTRPPPALPAGTISNMPVNPLPRLGDTVRAVDVAGLMGVEWRKVTKGVTGHPRFQTLIAAAGWEYVPGKGKRGSTFIRLASVPQGGPKEPLALVEEHKTRLCSQF